MNVNRLTRWTLLAAVVASSTACAPRFYQRSTVALDVGDDEGVQVHYAELDGCLFRQQVPAEYIVRRPRYTLHIRPVSALQSAPQLELRLQSEGDPSLRFEGLDEPAPAALYAEKGVRYLVETPRLHKQLHVSVLRDGAVIGEERFAVSDDHCRVLSPN